ncbi:MAG: hypothetical protein JW751_31700 [Polyangiaceae bacterium]|nr:hypothetical protein [Polyangiaceae bacterium]
MNVVFGATPALLHGQEGAGTATNNGGIVGTALAATACSSATVRPQRTLGFAGAGSGCRATIPPPGGDGFVLASR